MAQSRHISGVPGVGEKTRFVVESFEAVIQRIQAVAKSLAWLSWFQNLNKKWRQQSHGELYYTAWATSNATWNSI